MTAEAIGARPPAKAACAPETSGRRAAAREAKRARILEAARSVFRRLGYDGASMNDIAAEAGVSKPTLYVYFDNKEALFVALIEALKDGQPEVTMPLDPAATDPRAALIAFGLRLMRKLADPDRVGLLRMVIGACDKFPEIGRIVYEAGPRCGIDRLIAFLSAQEAAGRLSVPDKEIAAWQLLDLVQSRWARFVLLNVGTVPEEAALRRTVEQGVDVFLAAYGRGPSGSARSAL